MRLLTVIDSVGEHDGLGRLCHCLGITQLDTVMAPWASNKDRDDIARHKCRKRTDVKLKRAEHKIIAVKEGALKDEKAKRDGCTHETGIVNQLEADDVGTNETSSDEGWEKSFTLSTALTRHGDGHILKPKCGEIDRSVLPL